jgi:hypothetical protein
VIRPSSGLRPPSPRKRGEGHSTAGQAIERPSPYGVALQNIGFTAASASAELLDRDGNTIATASLSVESNRFVVREVMELFGPTTVPGAAIRVTSDMPIEVLGIAADQAAGAATPILAQ